MSSEASALQISISKRKGRYSSATEVTSGEVFQKFGKDAEDKDVSLLCGVWCNVKSAECSDFWLWNMGMLYTQYKSRSGLLSRVFQLLKS
jgi:hypothetical protein